MNRQKSRLIPYKKSNGHFNMAFDEELLDESIEKNSRAILRFYGWLNPTLSLGRNQKLTGINLDYCRENNIEIVKRPTGGRALLHDKELTYSFITPVELLKNGNSVISSYKEISEALILGFDELGIKLSYPGYKKVSPDDGYCMSVSTGSDLSYEGKKLIGSAQLRKKNYILQHGSILLDTNHEILSNIFKQNGGSRPTLHNLTTLKQINTELINIESLCNAITSGFEKKFSLEFDVQKTEMLV